MLNEWEDRALDRCGTDELCKVDVRRRYNELSANLHAAYQAALRNDWDEAQKINDATRKIIDDLLSKFPDLKQVRDILRSSIWSEDVQISIDSGFFVDGQPVFAGTSSRSSVVTPPCLSGSVTLSGTFSTDYSGSWDSASFGADITFGECTIDASGTALSTIEGGALKITVPGAGVLYGTVDPGDDKSTVSLSPGGQGFLDLTVTLAGGPTPWFYPVSGHYHLVFPISTHADGSIGVIVTPQYFRHAFPRAVFSFVDRNHDGVADQQDYAAYLAAFVAGDLSADMNGDGILDQTDEDQYLESLNYEIDLHR